MCNTFIWQVSWEIRPLHHFNNPFADMGVDDIFNIWIPVLQEPFTPPSGFSWYPVKNRGEVELRWTIPIRDIQRETCDGIWFLAFLDLSLFQESGQDDIEVKLWHRIRFGHTSQLKAVKQHLHLVIPGRVMGYTSNVSAQMLCVWNNCPWLIFLVKYMHGISGIVMASYIKHIPVFAFVVLGKFLPMGLIHVLKWRSPTIHHEITWTHVVFVLP